MYCISTKQYKNEPIDDIEKGNTNHVEKQYHFHDSINKLQDGLKRVVASGTNSGIQIAMVKNLKKATNVGKFRQEIVAYSITIG